MKPVLQALLIADRIYQDVTGKKIIAGTFNKLLFKKGGALPREVEEGGVKRTVLAGGAHPGSPYAFLSLTEVRGKVQCELRYVDLENDQPILGIKFWLECNDPLETVEVVLPMPPLPANKAGVNALELLCDNEPIGSLRIQVIEIKEDGNASS